MEGDGNGQYPAEAIAALQNATDTAAAIAENSHLSQKEIDDAVNALEEATISLMLQKSA
ncbi:MAG TPA: HU family DNA-binding protein [Clostridiales bacterium]|nr:HU family DNA-binding protein [Clostridiales bacterium]